jgi:hypothetical protein
MRKLVIVGALALVLGAAVPIAVFGAGIRSSSALDRQVAEWTERNATTSSTGWRNVPRLSRIQACTLSQVTADVTVTVSGAPVLFRMIIDTEEGPMRPGPARFVPDGKESFSATFVRRTFPFEDDDTHSFSLQWRSPTGQPVTLDSGVVNLLFKEGTHNCP